MIRAFITMVIALNAAGTVAYAAQDHLGSPEQQRACRPDILRHCRAEMSRSDQAMAGCLRKHARNLSPACQEALSSADR